MVSKDEIKDIVLKEKERSLFISRVPKKTKDEFVNFANEEFCEDYGMCLKSIWDNFKLWKVFFENIDMKLDYLINSLNKDTEKKEEPEENKIKLLSGKQIKVKGGKKQDGGIR